MSGATRFHLEVGDTLREPCFLNGNDLQRFDLVIAQPPPYYVADDDFGLNDRYRRFRYGAVQSSRADYAFVQHVIASVRAGGRAAVILPVTTFSRSGFEEEIRANLVHAGILSASISFEGGVLLGKNTPAGMLIFDLAKLFPVPERVLFIDTPVEKLSVHQQLAEQGTTPKKLILDTYRMQLTKQGLSKSASLAEVKARQYSLAPQAYIPKLGIARVNTDVLDQQIKTAENEIHEAHLFFQDALLSLRNKRPDHRTVKRVIQPE